jgi:echinoid protein
VQWFKEDDKDFVQTGTTLRLQDITAESNGRYICAATNYLQPSGGEKVMRTGNATIDIHVRHKPGQAFISPDKPVGVEGREMTLRCGANPPGYPRPTYNWWREDSGNSQILAVGSEFTIDAVNMNNAGRYQCQPVNDLGEGSVASVDLEVYQAPKIITQLQPNIMKRAGDTGFHITCSAVGKPKPQVRWFKDGEEIFENDLYEIATSEQEAIPNRGYNVLSTLKFKGPDRIGDNQLMPTDRGHYTCQFENQVSRSVTTMLLRIEHSPIVVHHHNKVAFDIGETAAINCQMQAFPSPRFDWSFGNNILQSDQYSYETNVTELENDVYEGILVIKRVNKDSYGDYICKASNTMGAKRTIIKLQAKGKPTEPTMVRAVESSYNFIVLAWDNGFDGGYNNTMFTVQYKKRGESSPRYHDCRFSNPCNLTGLDQHMQYNVRVKASNIRGESPFSQEVVVTTKVDAALIPSADNVHFATSNKQASFNLNNDHYLPLVAKIELENPDGSWTPFDELPMDGSASYGQLDIGDEVPVSNLRVRLCLETNDELCGPYSDARIVDVSPVLSSADAATAPWLIGVIILAVVVFIMALIVIIKCFCCNRKPKGIKSNVKGRPEIIHSTHAGTNNGGPPPYPSGYGIENKGVDTVKDDNLKNNIYSVQNGYEYNNEQSNSNSANGGSVNSQDSLWNVKGNPQSNMELHYQNAYMHQDGYHFDPMQQQHLQQMMPHGYMPQPQEDYAHYPYPDEYLNERNQQFLMGGGGDQAYGQVPNNARQQMEGDCKQRSCSK